uniref:Ubiquitin carboxyl-terminal hydrolase 7 n=1 Tax=Meloidogyne javanica TaxID=6303 RepID=A0A915LYV6_MELJA
MEVDITDEVLPGSPKNDQHQVVPEPPYLMNGDEDPYKPEGQITLKIEKFSEFAHEGPESRRLSEPVYIRGLPWKILAIPREMGRRPPMGAASMQKCLGYFLQCNADNTDPSWNCSGNATLKILAQKPGKEDHVRKISHVFHAKENDWGFAQFMTFENIMNPDDGWYDEETDTIILFVEVTADAPHGVNWDSKKDTGCIGLKNQGATCYMNSILQTLFFTNKLRKAVYQMPTDEDNPDSSVALAMQRVFFELQFSDSPVGTKKLTKSFGWDSIDSFLQHDVQEFCRVLLDNLENKMKNTKVVDTIPSLFKGCMKSYIKCKDVDFESSREECFYDLQLNVKNKSNVLESFKDYIETEMLDGDNKYDADFGLQPAEKGLKFLSFPPVLYLQLMRFQYDPLLDANVKINDRFEFTDTLDLTEFIETEEKENSASDEFTYLLHAVLVHSGDFHGGHYVAFININLRGTAKWCKFDDDVVSRVAYRDAVIANFGGENIEGMGRSCTNAYMLVYIQKKAIDDVLGPVLVEDIPEQLRLRFENEKKREYERRLEREEANNYCEISLILDEEMKSHHEFELFDSRTLEAQSRKLKVQKTMTYRDLYKFIAANLNIPETSFRLWDFQDDDRQGLHRFRCENSRPRNFLDPNETEDYSVPIVQIDRFVYLETGKPGILGGDIHGLKPYDRNSTVILNLGNEVGAHFEEINQIIGLPPDTRLNLYVEYKPDRIIPIMNANTRIRDVQMLTNDGSIIIAEDASKITEESNTQIYFRALYNRIEVEAHFHEFVLGAKPELEPPMQPIRGQIGLDWKLPKVCAWIASQIDYDPAKIILFKNATHTEKPANPLTHQHMEEYSLLYILGLGANNYDPRFQRLYKLFYSKLPITLEEFDVKYHILLYIMNDKFDLSELSVFVNKSATVQDILDEAKKDFKFSEDGTGILRSLYDMEIPKDQLQLGVDEQLLPVAHFEKEPTRTFGCPFFIKITNGEKYKFCIVKQNRILREFDSHDDSSIVNLVELLQSHITFPAAAPFLGIQHSNKSRVARGLLDSKKSIIIHN